jgi:hypothetical protein
MTRSVAEYMESKARQQNDWAGLEGIDVDWERHTEGEDLSSR